MERILYGIGWLFGLAIRGTFIGLYRLVVYGIFRYQRSHPAEFHVSDELRFEHTLITCGSGWGKTQLLQHTILMDLPRITTDNISIIVMDSQGDLLKKISQLAKLSPRSVESLSDRFIYIDPNDVENPPCLNLFDFGLERVKEYAPLDQERLINGAIAMYEFMFGALLGAELTNRQGVIFRYLARLMMVVPNPTIYTLMDFLENPETVRPFMGKLDLTTQRFMLTQFFSSGFDTTREQILTRLWGVLSNSALARMFSHTKNKLNLFEAMNNGSLILINTAKDLLKQEGCEIFGRFMVALISQATQERAALSEGKRKPCFVYIDEAHDYFDESLEQLLNTARKYKVGLTLSHQNLGQFHRKLEQTVLASTSLKWAGGNSADDAYQLAKEMNCEPDFIRQLQKEPGRAHFAFYARNMTPTAVEMVIPFGQIENQLKMSAEEYKELVEKNRKRVCAPYDKNLLTQSSAISQSGIVFDLEEQRAI